VLDFGVYKQPVGNSAVGPRLPISTTFNPRTYTPDMRYSTPVVRERLSRSILHEFSEEEAKLRIELAAVYRLYGKFGWTEGIYNHTTVRVPEPNGEHHYLINPLGLNYEEITASSLIKVDLEGNVIHPGVIGDIMGLNAAGLVIHSAIHAARPDVLAVSHTHHVSVAGISATKDGIVELCQTTHLLGPIAYHDYEGIAVDLDEQKRLVADMGTSNVLILRNHGVVTAGHSIGLAFYLMYLVVKACEMQAVACAAATGSRDKLLVPSDDVILKSQLIGKVIGGASLEFSAFMRLLDKEDDSYRN